MKYQIHGESRIGKRAVNQDRIAWRATPGAILMVVADGMGGHAHGEVAAQVAVDYLSDAFEHQAKPTLPDPFQFLAQCFNGAHAAITRVAGLRKLSEVPRTTCVACVIQDGLAHWVHAGDARLYLLRGNRIFQRSRDHTRVQLLLEQGLIDEAGAKAHPDRHRVYSCLGGTASEKGESPQMDFSAKTPLLPGDVIALCSDGVWGPAGDHRIVRCLTEIRPPQSVIQLLNDAEEKAGERADNLSLIALRWDTPSPYAAQLGSPSDEDIERAIDQIRGIIRPSQNSAQ